MPESNKKILLVSHETEFSSLLAGNIAAAHPTWVVCLASGGKEGLELLSNGSFDLLVCDLQLPVLDGVAFLTIARESSPTTIRLAVGLPQKTDAMLKAYALAQQCFAKPCQNASLMKVIEGSLTKADQLRDQDLKKVLLYIDSFPAIPVVHRDLLAALGNSVAGLDGVADLIAKDPGLTSKILQVANSSFFGSQQKISSIMESVALLGTNIIRTIAITYKFLGQLSSVEENRVLQQRLWEHSVEVSKIAMRLVDDFGSKRTLRDQACTLALLHDLGKLVLADFSPREYAAAVKASLVNGTPVWRMEKEHLGISHAEVGAILFSLWGLPADIVEAVRFHHEPSKCSLTGLSTELLAILHLSDLIEYKINARMYEGLPGMDVDFLKAQGLSVDLQYWTDWMKVVQ
jgi:putative nucleotidyltransferase with HDIG domain